MLGAIVGDVLGSPFEFSNTSDRFFELDRPVDGSVNGRLVSHRPRMTDESVMTVAVAKWLRTSAGHTSQDLVKELQYFGRKYSEGPYGMKFLKWLSEDNPQPANSYGNAAASRVSPVGMYAETLAQAKDLAERCAAVSHYHPEAIKGAQAIAACVWMARNGYDKEAIADEIETDFGYDVTSKVTDAKRREDLKGRSFEINVQGGSARYEMAGEPSDTSCQVTVPYAIRAFLESESFEDAVRRAISYGGDSDTIASMTASIAEMAYQGVPAKLETMVAKYLPEEISREMRQFEKFVEKGRMLEAARDYSQSNELKVLKNMPGDDGVWYVVRPSQQAVIDGLKALKGDDVRIITPHEAQDMLSSLERRRGTVIRGTIPELRTLFFDFQKNKLASVSTGSPSLTSEEKAYRETLRELADESNISLSFSSATDSQRMRVRGQFEELRSFVMESTALLQQKAGYNGPGRVQFSNALWAAVFHDEIRFYSGEGRGYGEYEGRVYIDPASGFIKTENSRVLRDGEYRQGDTFRIPMFPDNGTDGDSSYRVSEIKERVSMFLLGEGIPTRVKEDGVEGVIPDNVEMAAYDLSRTKDPEILHDCSIPSYEAGRFAKIESYLAAKEAGRVIDTGRIEPRMPSKPAEFGPHAVFVIPRGYQSSDEFMKLCRMYNIDLVVYGRDYSNIYNDKEFSSEAVEKKAEDAGIDFVDMSDQLGTRKVKYLTEVSNTEYSTSYLKLTSSEEMGKAVERLKSGIEKNYRMVILTDGLSPERCNAFTTVGALLKESKIDVEYINQNGKCISQLDLEKNLVKDMQQTTSQNAKVSKETRRECLLKRFGETSWRPTVAQVSRTMHREVNRNTHWRYGKKR